MLAKKRQNRKDLKQGFLKECLEQAEGGQYSINAESTVSMDNQKSHFEIKENEEREYTGLDQFNNQYQLNARETFRNLTDRYEMDTNDFEVINIAITYGSKYAIAIVKDSALADKDRFEIQGYSLNSFTRKWNHSIEGLYIKMKLIEQSDDGKTLAFAYQDDGVFNILLMTADGEFIDDINVSKLLFLDNKAKPVEGFWEPGIVCSFIPGQGTDLHAGTNLMIAVYHRFEKKQYHFNYSIKDKKIVGDTRQSEMTKTTLLNFPIKSFYTPLLDANGGSSGSVLIFYRQGQCFTINPQDTKDCRCEKLTDADFGSMFLLFDQALIVRSSSSILFFKIHPETKMWYQYHVIPKMRGDIFFIKGNIRFQITTDEKIFFYMIDKQTLIPKLENVMFNFMNCSQMMFGSMVRYCITFKTNQPNFHIWVRKAYHNFKVALTNDNMEGSMGANLTSLNQYVMTEKKIEQGKTGPKEKQVISVHENDAYSTLQEFTVPTREEGIEILYICVSKDDQKIGVALGKKLIKQKQVITEIAVYNRQLRGDKFEFSLEALKEFQYPSACMRFEFNKKNNNQLIFFSRDNVFMIDIQDESFQKTIYKYSSPLDDTPMFGVFNQDQNKFIVTSATDVRYCNIEDPSAEVDLDDELNLQSIKSICADDLHFYILAGKHDKKLGFYLYQVKQDKPTNVIVGKNQKVQQNVRNLISWNNKMDIDNCEMAIMVDEFKDEDGNLRSENQIVVSYKMIGFNTFNVFCFDLTDNYLIKYWYEGYQLWESPIRGFLLANNDFLMLSKDGINLIALGHKENKQVIDKDNQKRLMHALGSCDYLKIEKTNHLLFACQYYHDRQICLQEQYNDGKGFTHFDDLFRIKIHEITLRELLLIQSIYNCKTQSDIEIIVKDQPNPLVFFKVFLELGIKNLVPYIAFDARSMRELLDQKNKQYFSDEFPLFYKNQDGRSAIDTALENNQIRSVNLMIQYIVEYQNSYYYCHLFNYNAVELLNKGVQMTKLFKSNIFNHTFDYDEWPSTNSDTKKGMSPFNESMFKLRHHYKDVFPALWKKDQKKIKKTRSQIDREFENEAKGSQVTEKVYKIKYQLNLITSMSEEDGTLMDAVANSDELGIFKTDLIKDMIDYKWNTFARRQHLFGGFVHLCYVIVLIMYVNHTFLDYQAIFAEQIMVIEGAHKDSEVDNRIFPACNKYYMWAIAACLIYPLIYDGTQLVKQRSDYFRHGANYIDICHISFGYLNILFQMSDNGTWNIYSKILMIVVILTCLIKTLFFMKIFTNFSYIVTMIIGVVIDLQIFLIFFAILITMFSMVFNVITRNEAPEYSKIGYLMGNLFTTFRLALGDFDFSMIEDKPLTKQHILFWVTWLIMVIFSSLIFLNFIIAEVSSSYNKVKQNIDSLIYKERAALISEVEDIKWKRTKKNNIRQFPKYIVVREQED